MLSNFDEYGEMMSLVRLILKANLNSWMKRLLVLTPNIWYGTTLSDRQAKELRILTYRPEWAL